MTNFLFLEFHLRNTRYLRWYYCTHLWFASLGSSLVTRTYLLYIRVSTAIKDARTLDLGPISDLGTISSNRALLYQLPGTGTRLSKTSHHIIYHIK